MRVQTKTGLHYHVGVGPKMVRLFDTPPMAGPYYDIIINDIDDAFGTLTNVIYGHIQDYLDEEDKEEVYAMVEYMTETVEAGEEPISVSSLSAYGFDFYIVVCPGCIPVGTN